jgi:hypothetical protein
MRAIFAVAATLALIAGTALGQTAPTNPSASSITQIGPAPSTQPINPYPYYSSTSSTGSSFNKRNQQDSVHIFTADQAKTRLELKGYSNVSGLQKGTDGIWRGQATRGEKPVNVMLFFEGDIVTN